MLKIDELDYAVTGADGDEVADGGGVHRGRHLTQLERAGRGAVSFARTCSRLRTWYTTFFLKLNHMTDSRGRGERQRVVQHIVSADAAPPIDAPASMTTSSSNAEKRTSKLFSL
jgi:hypothetical protein